MILVTGGSGFVGGHVVRALLARGERVRCLARPGRPLGSLEGLDVERVPGDVLDPASVRAALRGCRVVYHCAADYRLSARDPGALHRTNVDGTDNVLAAAVAAGVERIVYTGTVASLRTGSSPADERAPARLDALVGPYKRSKWHADRVVERHAAGGAPVVTVCPSAPVGEGDVKPTPTGRIIVDYLTGRRPAYVATTGLNLVDVRDVAAGHLLAERQGRPGERYILGGRNMSLEAILACLSGISGRPPVRLRIPYGAALAIGGVDTLVARLRGREPRVPLEGVRMAARPMYVDATKAVAELGLPQSPVEGALERAVAWFRDHGYA